jgi:signal transduction histidine kinase
MTLTDARRGLGTPRQVGLAAPDIDLAIVGSAFRVQGRPGALIVGLESQGFLDARHELSVVLLVGLPLAVVLSGALAWALTGRTLRSVRRLAEEADAISLGEPGRSLVVDTRDTEVARLVAALNRMLTRLDSRYAVNLAAAAATTHRLRTPLATLRLDAELGLAEDDPEATRETLKRVIADVDRLGSLVDLLLANADLRTEHRVLLTDAVAELGEEWQRQARTRRRDLLIEVSGQGSLDVNILRAAADPLVENAIEYSAGDEPIVARLTVRDVEGHDAELTVEIENTGLGVPPDVTGRLFEPWTGTRNSGLGLWLAREAARAGGGEISCVEPGPPRTVFRLVLPVAGPIPA